jgi:glutathione peroxidase-family protein
MKFFNILCLYLNSQEGNVAFASLCLIVVQIGKLMKLCSRNHVAIIVNVASKCGLTATNYKELAELHDNYAESKGLCILAFPCNQFKGQVRLTRVSVIYRVNTP